MMRTFLFILLVCFFFSCKRATSNSVTNTSSERGIRRAGAATNIVKMTSESGVFYIPIKINDVDMKIIFDTGASSISISETEAIFLIKQGKITEEDILGRVEFQDATGNISEGTRINLKKVKIGNKEIYNVEASVVHNLNAPLLLGQTALSKFGRLTIDYGQNVIIFD